VEKILKNLGAKKLQILTGQNIYFQFFAGQKLYFRLLQDRLIISGYNNVEFGGQVRLFFYFLAPFVVIYKAGR
jgi:hypothetical protein